MLFFDGEAAEVRVYHKEMGTSPSNSATVTGMFRIRRASLRRQDTADVIRSTVAEQRRQSASIHFSTYPR